MEENTIRKHVYSIPELVVSQADILWERVVESLPGETLVKIKKVIVTGCGYSYAASSQAKYLLESIAGIPAEAVYSVDASRHLDLHVLPEETLFIAVSSSGIVARIAEALERFDNAGMVTLAFSSNPESRCAKKSRYVIDISCPEMTRSLPLRSYVMTVMAYYFVAWRIALEKGRAGEEERKNFSTQLRYLADRIGQSLTQIDNQTASFANQTALCKAHEFVGSGIEYGAAWLGKQQIIGQSGKCGVECSLEDWLHSNFFWNEPEKIGTMLFLPSNTRALSRALEVQEYMLYLGRPLCVVTDLKELVRPGATTILLPQTESYLLNPLLEMIPVSLYAGEVTQIIGEAYSRGFKGRWDFSKDGRATEFSEIQMIE